MRRTTAAKTNSHRWRRRSRCQRAACLLWVDTLGSRGRLRVVISGDHHGRPLAPRPQEWPPCPHILNGPSLSTGGTRHGKMFGCVREKGQVSGPLQRNGKEALMFGTGPCPPARVDPGPVRDVAPQAAYLLVVDKLHLIHAEGTDPATGVIPWPSIPPARGTCSSGRHTVLLLLSTVAS